MDEEENVFEVKTILVGMTGTGKTNIINALVDRPFDESKISTLTSSFVDKFMLIGNSKYHIELWDTAGQEQYKSLTKIFIQDSKIVIFVYDITNSDSFQEVDYWVQSVKEQLGETPILGLVANKKDLFMKEQVDEDTGRSKAEEIGARFKLTSAKTERTTINEYMKELLEVYIRKNGGKIDKVVTRGMSLDSYTGMNIEQQKDRSKCCN